MLQPRFLYTVGRLSRRGCSFLCAALFALAGTAWAQIPADVEFAGQTAGTPHPSTYSWSGERQAVTEPGGNFYYYYYAGTVQPDARVNAEDRIERIPVRTNEWEKCRGYLIAKLTNFYQVSNNLQPTALQEYERNQGVGDSRVSAAATPAPVLAAPLPGGGFDQFGGTGAAPGAIPPLEPGAVAPTYDPRAAAEWTFYYDQLVLWQYYCTRVLLGDEGGQLLEPDESSESQRQQQQPAAGTPPAPGYDIGVINPFQQTPAPAAPTMVAAGASGLRVREVFDPMVEYREPTTNQKFRDKYMNAAQNRERKIYDAFIAMLSEIDRREQANQRYDQWLATREAQIHDFADNWRKLREGETLIVDQTMFLITPEKLESPPLDAINLERTERLTPQDLLNPDGSVKAPKIQ